MNGYVYLVGSREQTAVKIGHTRNLDDRLRTLQTGNPSRLEVLDWFAGSSDVERLAHAWFHRYRVQGEWFEFGSLNSRDMFREFVQVVLDARCSLRATVPVVPQTRRSRTGPRVTTEDRCAQVVALLREEGGCSLSALAVRSGASKSVMKRVLEQLLRNGLAWKDPAGLWFLA